MAYSLGLRLQQAHDSVAQTWTHGVLFRHFGGRPAGGVLSPRPHLTASARPLKSPKPAMQDRGCKTSDARPETATSEVDGRPQADDEGILGRMAEVVWIRHVSARMDEILQVRLKRPPWRQLRGVVELEHRLAIANGVWRAVDAAYARSRAAASLLIFEYATPKVTGSARVSA